MTPVARSALAGGAAVCVSFVATMAAAPGTGADEPAALASSPAPSITAVAFQGSVTQPKVVITGVNLGSAPASVAAGCGASGRDYLKNKLYLLDIGRTVWSAGRPGDCIGLVVSHYAATQITFQLGSGYHPQHSTSALKTGDQFVVSVSGTTVSGTVSYPRISAVTFSGSTTTPTVTVTGSGFGRGPAEPAMNAGCRATGSDFPLQVLYLTDATAKWGAGQVGPGVRDCIGLVLSRYTDTKIVFTFGSWYDAAPRHLLLGAGDHFTVGVGGTTVTGTVTYR